MTRDTGHVTGDISHVTGGVGGVGSEHSLKIPAP